MVAEVQGTFVGVVETEGVALVDWRDTVVSFLHDVGPGVPSSHPEIINQISDVIKIKVNSQLSTQSD